MDELNRKILENFQYATPSGEDGGIVAVKFKHPELPDVWIIQQVDPYPTNDWQWKLPYRVEKGWGDQCGHCQDDIDPGTPHSFCLLCDDRLCMWCLGRQLTMKECPTVGLECEFYLD